MTTFDNLWVAFVQQSESATRVTGAPHEIKSSSGVRCVRLLGKGCCTAHRAVDDDGVVDSVGPNLNDGVAGRSIQVLWSSMLGGRCMDPALVTAPRLFGRVEQPAMNSNVSVAAMKAICFLFLI
jgi:hypothetical protein